MYEKRSLRVRIVRTDSTACEKAKITTKTTEIWKQKLFESDLQFLTVFRQSFDVSNEEKYIYCLCYIGLVLSFALRLWKNVRILEIYRCYWVRYGFVELFICKMEFSNVFVQLVNVILGRIAFVCIVFRSLFPMSPDNLVWQMLLNRYGSNACVATCTFICSKFRTIAKL